MDSRDGRDNHDDWTLLRRARAGDTRAWEQLWLRHRDRLFRVALAVTRDREAARDVAQSVLLRLVDGRPPGREEDLPRYLATAAWRSALRQEERRRRLEPLEAVTETAAAGGPDDGERRNAALRALETLPPAQRDTLALRLVGGLSYEETAHVLGVPLGTVRSRLHAGIRACRDLLNRKGHGE